jgi:hypothetical protein
MAERRQSLKRGSCAYVLSFPIRDVLEEVASLISEGTDLEPEQGIQDALSSYGRDLKISGFVRTPTDFLSDLLGDGRWEMEADVEPVAELYRRRGLPPQQPFQGTREEEAELQDEVLEALPFCHFVLTLQVHTMDYLFKGDLRRGVTWQGWE